MEKELEQVWSDMKKGPADILIENAEKEFTTLSLPEEEKVDIKTRKRIIQSQIKTKEIQLSKCRNVRNSKAATVNKILAEKRRKIRATIEKLKTNLADLEIEEQGSAITSSQIEKATGTNLQSDNELTSWKDV